MPSRDRGCGPVQLLTTIPGVEQRTAEVIFAQLGPDMRRFPDHRHVAGWAAICPGNEESAGKRKTGKTRKGDSWLRTALIEAANSAAARTRDTYLNAHTCVRRETPERLTGRLVRQLERLGQSVTLKPALEAT